MWRLRYEFAATFITFICISYLLRKFTLILSGRHSSSHENKSWRSLYIFLKSWCMKVWYFKLTWWYASISLLVLCSLDSGLCQGYFVRLKKCELMIILDFLLQSCVLKNNYRTVHWHIRPQSDNEQGINKLRS